MLVTAPKQTVLKDLRLILSAIEDVKNVQGVRTLPPPAHSVRNQPDKAYSTGITTAKSQQPSQQSEVFIKIEFN